MNQAEFWVCDSSGSVRYGTSDALPTDESSALHDAFLSGRTQFWLSKARRAQVRPMQGSEQHYLVIVSHSRARELSPRQLEVAEYAAVGATIAEIGRQLRISPHTVRHHLKSVYRLLEVACRVELSAALGEAH